MSMDAETVLSLAESAFRLARKIEEWVRTGVSDEEIRKRLSDPAGIGQDMIERARLRQQRGRDLLGRDPQA